MKRRGECSACRCAQHVSLYHQSIWRSRCPWQWLQLLVVSLSAITWTDGAVKRARWTRASAKTVPKWSTASTWRISAPRLSTAAAGSQKRSARRTRYNSGLSPAGDLCCTLYPLLVSQTSCLPPYELYLINKFTRKVRPREQVCFIISAVWLVGLI